MLELNRIRWRHIRFRRFLAVAWAVNGHKISVWAAPASPAPAFSLSYRAQACDPLISYLASLSVKLTSRRSRSYDHTDPNDHSYTMDSLSQPRRVFAIRLNSKVGHKSSAVWVVSYSLLQNQLPAARKISPRGARLQASVHGHFRTENSSSPLHTTYLRGLKSFFDPKPLHFVLLYWFPLVNTDLFFF